MVIQLMNYNMLFRNSVNRLLDVSIINNTVLRNITKHRSLFILTNATFRINNLNRNDSGNYKVFTAIY